MFTWEALKYFAIGAGAVGLSFAAVLLGIKLCIMALIAFSKGRNTPK